MAEIDAQLEDLEKELLKRANAKQDYTDILEQLDTMRDAKQELLLEDASTAGVQHHLHEIEAFLETQQTDIEEYDEDLVRMLMRTIIKLDFRLVETALTTPLYTTKIKLYFRLVERGEPEWRT